MHTSCKYCKYSTEEHKVMHHRFPGHPSQSAAQNSAAQNGAALQTGVMLICESGDTTVADLSY